MRYAFSASSPVRAGVASERYELRPGDCYGDDCSRTPKYERAESAQNGLQQVEGEEYWYGWSFFVPANYAEPVDGFAHYGQFQQHSNFDPIWMFTKFYKGDYVLRYNAVATNGGGPNFVLLTDSEFRGRWHDVVVHARWSTANGFTNVWINGRLSAEYVGPTRTVGNTDVYFKYGVYRQAKNETAVVYYDELRRGKNRSSVDIRMLDR